MNAFDPQARCLDEQGFSYRNAACYLKGERDPEDLCNHHNERYIREGWSAEQRLLFRKNYSEALAKAVAQGCNEAGDEAYWTEVTAHRVAYLASDRGKEFTAVLAASQPLRGHA